MQLVCRICGTVFSEERARLNPMNPEEEEVHCPECNSTAIDTYAFDPDSPIEEFADEEEL